MLEGGCLCGAVRWQLDGDVGAAAYCHCEDCRRCTGSAFNVSVRAQAADFHIVKGEPKVFTKEADSGRPVARFFCADCGSPIHTLPPRHPEMVFIKAGSFDDPTAVKPAMQAWTRSAVSWSKIPEGL